MAPRGDQGRRRHSDDQPTGPALVLSPETVQSHGHGTPSFRCETAVTTRSLCGRTTCLPHRITTDLHDVRDGRQDDDRTLQGPVPAVVHSASPFCRRHFVAAQMPRRRELREPREAVVDGPPRAAQHRGGSGVHNRLTVAAAPCTAMQQRAHPRGAPAQRQPFAALRNFLPTHDSQVGGTRARKPVACRAHRGPGTP